MISISNGLSGHGKHIPIRRGEAIMIDKLASECKHRGSIAVDFGHWFLSSGALDDFARLIRLLTTVTLCLAIVPLGIAYFQFSVLEIPEYYFGLVKVAALMMASGMFVVSVSCLILQGLKTKESFAKYLVTRNKHMFKKMAGGYDTPPLASGWISSSDKGYPGTTMWATYGTPYKASDGKPYYRVTHESTV